jgi:hypothetical protein
MQVAVTGLLQSSTATSLPLRLLGFAISSPTPPALASGGALARAQEIACHLYPSGLGVQICSRYMSK